MKPLNIPINQDERKFLVKVKRKTSRIHYWWDEQFTVLARTIREAETKAKNVLNSRKDVTTFKILFIEDSDNDVII